MQRDTPPVQAAPGGGGQQVVIWARAGQWNEAGRHLDGQNMVAVLNLLEDVRSAGLLDQFQAHVDSMPGIKKPRMWAAVLTVGHHIGERWKQHWANITEGEQDAIRTHVIKRMEAGDAVVHNALLRAGDRAPFLAPIVESNAAWITAFLKFFGFGPPTAADPQAQTATFNSAQQTRAYIVDMVTEQAGRDGRLLDPTEVDTVAKQFHPTWVVPPPLPRDPMLTIQVVVPSIGLQVPLSKDSSMLVAKGGLDQAFSTGAAAGVNLLLHRKLEGLSPGLEIGIQAGGGAGFNVNTASAPATKSGKTPTLTAGVVQGFIQPTLVLYSKPEKGARHPLALWADQFALVGQFGGGYTSSQLPGAQGPGIQVFGGPQFTWNLVGEKLQLTAAPGGGHSWAWPLDADRTKSWVVGFSVGIQWVIPAVTYSPQQPSP